MRQNSSGRPPRRRLCHYGPRDPTVAAAPWIKLPHLRVQRSVRTPHTPLAAMQEPATLMHARSLRPKSRVRTDSIQRRCPVVREWGDAAAEVDAMVASRHVCPHVRCPSRPCRLGHGLGRHIAGHRVRPRAAQAARRRQPAHHVPPHEPAPVRWLLLRRDRPAALQVLHPHIATAVRDVEQYAANRLRLSTLGRTREARTDPDEIRHWSLVSRRLLHRRCLRRASSAAMRKHLPLPQRTLRTAEPLL